MKEKDSSMDLKNAKNINTVVSQSRLLMFLFAAILVIGFIGAFVVMSMKVDEAYNKTFIFDTKGQVYETSTIETGAMRSYEYESHIRNFVNKWYAFDEYTYETNINGGLELIGDKGKELLNEYNDLNILNVMIQKNIRYGVLVNDININMNTIPVSGSIRFSQTGYRAKGSASREVVAKFTLYDVARSRKNPHGCKIREWDVEFYDKEEE